MLGSDGNLRVSLYKALLFIHVMGAIKSGTLNLEHSYKYRTLDNYMIDRAHWRRDKPTLLARAGLASFAQPKQVLDELDRALHAQYVKTNMNLVAGNNSWVKLNKDNTLTISTPKVDDADAAPLQTFFPERDYISLLEVLATVNRYSGFLRSFRTGSSGTIGARRRRRPFLPGLLAWGAESASARLLGFPGRSRGRARVYRQLVLLARETCTPANDKVLQLIDHWSSPTLPPLSGHAAYLQRWAEV